MKTCAKCGANFSISAQGGKIGNDYYCSGRCMNFAPSRINSDKLVSNIVSQRTGGSQVMDELNRSRNAKTLDRNGGNKSAFITAALVCIPGALISENLADSARFIFVGGPMIWFLCRLLGARYMIAYMLAMTALTGYLWLAQEVEFLYIPLILVVVRLCWEAMKGSGPPGDGGLDGSNY